MKETAEIGSSKITIFYTDSNGIQHTIAEGSEVGNSLTIGFNRDTGGFQPIDTDVYCKSITISSGSNSKSIICEKLTGKIRTQ